MSGNKSATTSNPAIAKVMFSSASDDWATPQAFYDEYDAEFGFVLDACSSTTNHKAPHFFALDHPDAHRRDGLTGDWAADARAHGGAVWCNPVYGRSITDWMAKAAATARAGVTVVCLVPARTDTRWFHEHVLAEGAEVRYVRGRLKFGTATTGAPFASLVIIYRGHSSAEAEEAGPDCEAGDTLDLDDEVKPQAPREHALESREGRVSRAAVLREAVRDQRLPQGERHSTREARRHRSAQSEAAVRTLAEHVARWQPFEATSPGHDASMTWSPVLGTSDGTWRRVWDLNPRGVSAWSLSRRLHSATMRTLQVRGPVFQTGRPCCTQPHPSACGRSSEVDCAPKPLQHR
ncbi:hypothetical protein GCM10009721_39180 [Terrabacter tumescens]|uniref:Adenine methyltransferase n=1 Tax=Terrabacter tumescens TaxID=60443 RepID=A0ABQ2IEM9_9MICO|nr:hypothetical protein GCM10009721_39180 [Terrabacter tumescens]